jgi:hypothetical protein
MKQGHTTVRTISSRGDRTVATFITVAAAMLLSVVGWEAAPAQTSPTVGAPSGLQQQGTDPRLKAPIGHRQPRPSDLPPNVRRNEGRPLTTDRDLDERLKICREC